MIIDRLLKRLPSEEQRSSSAQEAWEASIRRDWGVHAPTEAGVSVDDNQALKLAAVYASIRIRASSIGLLPAYAVDEDGPTKTLPKIVRKPNDEISWPSFVEQLVTSLDLRGNAYVVPTWHAGRVQEVSAIDPDAVSVYRDDRTRRKVIAVNGKPTRPHEVLHIPGIMLPGRVEGLSPIDAAREVIGQSLVAEKHAATFFKSGGAMRGVIETPETMSRDAVKEMLNGFNSTYSGTSSSHSVGALTGGAAYKQLSVTPEQAQFLESRQWSARVISGMIFGVPPNLIGLSADTSLNSGLEALTLNFVTFGLLPTITRLQHGLSALISPDPDRQLRIQPNGLMRADYNSRMTGYRVGREAGFLSSNDVRRLEDLPPLDVPGADDYFRPANWARLDEQFGNPTNSADEEPPAIVEEEPENEGAEQIGEGNDD